MNIVPIEFSMPLQAPEGFLPLTPLTLSVLVTLGERPRHGYALMKDLEAREGPGLVSGAGSLYAALDRLTESGLLAAEEDLEDPRRRRRFSVTELGRTVALAEMRRLEDVIGRGRALLPEAP